MPGPLPKPTVLRLVESGGRLRGRFKERAAKEPKVRSGLGEPPGYLNADQLHTWFRLSDAAPEGLLTALDRDLFEGFVVLAAVREKLCKEYNEGSGQVIAQSPDDDKRLILVSTLREYKRLTELLRVLGREFGFSPAARTRIQLEQEGAGPDPLAEFFGGGAAR